jgi:hypothetical protein
MSVVHPALPGFILMAIRMMSIHRYPVRRMDSRLFLVHQLEYPK